MVPVTFVMQVGRHSFCESLHQLVLVLRLHRRLKYANQVGLFVKHRPDVLFDQAA